MGKILGIDASDGILRAAVLKNGAPVAIAESGDRNMDPGRLRVQAQARLGMAVEDAVLVAPACATIPQQEDLRHRFRQAGFRPVRVISRHDAVALYYGYEKQPKKEERLLILEQTESHACVSVFDVGDGVVEALATGLGKEPMNLIRQMLENAGSKAEDVKTVLLLGDAGKDRELTRNLQNAVGAGTPMLLCPAQAVVLGAALQGGVLDGSRRELLLSVTPWLIGLAGEDGVFTPMIKANTTIPTVKAQPFALAEGRNTLDFCLMQKREETLIPLGSYRVTGIPAGSKGVEIRLNLDADGRLRTSAACADDWRKQLELTATCWMPENLVSDPPEPAAGIPDYDRGKTEALLALLPVYDNLELAISQLTADTAYKKGVELTFRSLTKALADLGAEAYGEVGEPFDPKIHNAVMHMTDETLGENVICQVYRRGFRMNGKVLRFADVHVAN